MELQPLNPGIDLPRLNNDAPVSASICNLTIRLIQVMESPPWQQIFDA